MPIRVVISLIIKIVHLQIIINCKRIRHIYKFSKIWNILFQNEENEEKVTILMGSKKK